MRQITLLPVPSGQTHRTHCTLEDNEVEGVKTKRVRDKGGGGKKEGNRGEGAEKGLENKMAERAEKQDWGGGLWRDVRRGEVQRLSSQKPLSAVTCCEGSPFAPIHRHLQEGRQHISPLQVLT